MKKSDLVFIAGAWILSLVAIGFMAKLMWTLVVLGWSIL